MIKRRYIYIYYYFFIYQGQKWNNFILIMHKCLSTAQLDCRTKCLITCLMCQVWNVKTNCDKYFSTAVAHPDYRYVGHANCKNNNILKKGHRARWDFYLFGQPNLQKSRMRIIDKHPIYFYVQASCIIMVIRPELHMDKNCRVAPSSQNTNCESNPKKVLLF